MGILEKVVGFIKEKIQASIRERAIKKAKKKLKKLYSYLIKNL